MTIKQLPLLVILVLSSVSIHSAEMVVSNQNEGVARVAEPLTRTLDCTVVGCTIMSKALVLANLAKSTDTSLWGYGAAAAFGGALVSDSYSSFTYAPLHVGIAGVQIYLHFTNPTDASLWGYGAAGLLGGAAAACFLEKFKRQLHHHEHHEDE